MSRAAEETPLLAHSPTVSQTHVVFAYGGYLWSDTARRGRCAQLTTGGHEGLPVFSPDGKWIAFSGQYDGNLDVFVMPAEGGEPRRLTWHPVPTSPWVDPGWEARAFLFRREAYADFSRLYTVRWRAARPRLCLCGAEKRRGSLPTGHESLCAERNLADGLEALSAADRRRQFIL